MSENEAYLQRYQSGRYQIVNGPVQVVFSGVKRTHIRGDFKLLDKRGGVVGRVNRVVVDGDIRDALDGVSEGDDLDFDEFVPGRYKETEETRKVRLYCAECDFEKVYDDGPDDPWTEGAMAHGMKTGHKWEVETLSRGEDQ